MAEIVGEYGGVVGGGQLEYTYGIPYEQWQSWDDLTRGLWIQDYHRTLAQQNYATDSTQSLAFDYVNWMDDYAIDPTKDAWREDIAPALRDATFGIVPLALIAILVLRK